MDFFQEFDVDKEKILEIIDPFFKFYNDSKLLLDRIEQDIINYNKVKSFAILNDISSTVEPDVQKELPYIESPKTGRSKRSALQTVNGQRNISVAAKDITTNLLTNIKQEIQEEEISQQSELEKENQDAQKEMPPPSKPAAKRGRAPKKLKSEKVSQIKVEKDVELELHNVRTTDVGRSSDVILQNNEVPVIELLDSSSENLNSTTNKRPKKASNASIATAASTRSKRVTKKTAKEAIVERKRSRSLSSDEETKQKVVAKPSRTKRNKMEETEKPAEGSIYEDARSSVESNKQRKNSKPDLCATYICNNDGDKKVMDTTVVIDKGNAINNETIVISKQNPIMNETVVLSKKTTPDKNNIDDLMTDDDTATPNKIQSNVSDGESSGAKKLIRPQRIVKGTKQIFSPFENSPVKKRVEAFEKIAAETALDAPTRMTRSKRTAQKKNEEEGTSKLSVKSKPYTPLAASKLPKSILSTSKVSKAFGTPLKTTNDSIISEKSASALKASQQKYEEREMRRKEKEMEVLRQMEEKRRKREEKHIKAQQNREEEEKKKKKFLEEQLQKESEKYKQALAEKEEKLKKQKAEAEKKRLLAAKKAMEEKRKEEERKLVEQEEKQKLAEEEKKLLEQQKLLEAKKAQMAKPGKNLPIYMTKKAPLLPTDDCYDSDDAEAETQRAKIPQWARKEVLHRSLRVMEHCGYKLRNTFFCMAPQTPDLREIFQQIDPRKLKRTSSAVWRKPPRFTLLPTAEESFNESLEA